jgi:hypothetical protein
MDTRRWGPGERIVFEPYSAEMFSESREWIAERGIFGQGGMGSDNWSDAIIRIA